MTDTATPAASYLTQEAYDRLKGELTQLSGEGRTDIAKKIEAELQYPGQIKVTVIREMRAVDYAK